ncbi:restriction endonuclease subunit S [Corynebacterium striatum]|uniref:restriction endonuclease subunit S n=1 Tax=Corynebacterium striatum TaxID=43770 RepID=UPI00080A83A4|nr:restriction endonuclease subunit S [Corynebacterium striatum]
MPNLKELTTKIGSGSTPRGGKSAYIDSGIPIIRSQNIIDLSFHESGLAFISEEQARAMEGVSVHLNDVLLNITGDSTARVAIWNRRQQARVNQHVAIIRANPDQLDPYWLMYWLYSPEVKQHLLMLASSGASRAALTKGMLEQLELPDFSVRQQQSISAPLRALDDKISTNRDLISRIDGLLDALWLKELALSNVSASLSSLASFINGRAFTKGASGTGRVVVRIAEMNSGIGSRTVYSDIDAAPDNVVDPGELLFSWSGTLMTKRWPYDQAIVNQHIFKVVPNGQLDLWALRQAIDAQLEYFRMIAAGKATTMGHIKRGDLDQEVEVPAQMSEETNQLGNSLWGLATSLESQNLQLARTRDELLPLLMSGRITVGEAEDVAGTAASES